MKHIGLISPPVPGHLNPMLALGNSLLSNDYKVTLVSIRDVESQARNAGVDFVCICEKFYPKGSLVKALEKQGRLSGLEAVLHTSDMYRRTAEMMLDEAPAVLNQQNFDLLLIDQTLYEGSTIADFIQVPFITICSALLFNPELSVPPPLTSFEYQDDIFGNIRNTIAYISLGFFGVPYLLMINRYRLKFGLAPLFSIEDSWSKIASISQQITEFEFPRSSLPNTFHFTGPFVNKKSREVIEFPYEQLNGKPLIYASLGTAQNRLLSVFEKIAKACSTLDVQLVLSLGGGADPEDLPNLEGQPIVVKNAPQLLLLEKASLTITHAGINTTLESLSNGVPMVAIPITNDQPAVAARIAWTKTGKVIQLADLTVQNVKSAISKVLQDDTYRANAKQIQKSIEYSGGIDRATKIIDQYFKTSKPVINYTAS